MAMSELQDALDNMSRYGFPAIDTPREWVVTDPIVEAARLVANPNIKAAAKAYANYRGCTCKGKCSACGWGVERTVAAALTPGDK